MSGSAPKKTERQLAGIECNGCNKIFATHFHYDQHRRSNALSGTACSSLPDMDRTNLLPVCSEHVHCLAANLAIA